MAKKTKRLLALLIASVMCFSLCLPSFADSETIEKNFFDFETDNPGEYFSGISGWMESTTSSAFTIDTCEAEGSEAFGKSLKYVNNAGNEQGRIRLDGTYGTVGFDFSFCFESASNGVNLSFRQGNNDLYVIKLNTGKKVLLFDNEVATYETGVWYDISIIFSVNEKYARLKFKPSASDEWKEFDGFYSGTVAAGTSGLFFDIYGGADNDGGVKYFDNLRVYIPGDDFKPSLSTYSDDFDAGINHASSVTDYTTYWRTMNTNSQTEIAAEPLGSYEGNVLKLKDISADTTQVNLTIGKYPFTLDNAPNVRHIMTYKMGSSFDGGVGAVYMKFVSPQRGTTQEMNILTLKENEIVMKDVDGSYSFDAKIEPDTLYDVALSYDASKKVAALSVMDGNAQIISKFLNLGFYDSSYGYIYNIEFANSSAGQNTVYIDDFFWDINTSAIDFTDAYIKSQDYEGADIDETVIFEYTDVVEENITPDITIEKNGEAANVAHTIVSKGNTVWLEFEELEKNTFYNIILSGIKSAYGDAAPETEISFTTSEFTVCTDEVQVSEEGVITALVNGAYEKGLEIYIVASAYDDDDNIVEAKFLSIDVPYRNPQTITFTPSFDSEYSYIKATVMRSLESAIYYCANIPSNSDGSSESDADETYEAISGIEVSEDTFTVSGYNVFENESVVAIQILKSGKTWNNLAAFDYDNGDVTEYLSDYDAIGNLEYNAPYSFTKKLSDGGVPAFRIRFGDGDIIYYDPVLMENINSAQSPQELMEIVKADAAVWDEMSDIVEALSEEEEENFWRILFETKETLATQDPLSLPAQVTALAPGVSTLARLGAVDVDDMEELMTDFAQLGVFSGNSYDIYAGIGDFEGYGMSQSQKEKFNEYISRNVNKYEFVEDFVSDFEENAVYFAINGGSKQAIDVVISYSDLIDQEEISTYSDLSAAKKRNVCAIIGSDDRYTSIDALQRAIEAQAKSEKKGKDTSSGGGGGGGGTQFKGESFVTIGEDDKAKVEGLVFNDIANVEWATKAITTLANEKIVSGDGNGTFRPNSFVTREEFVKMLVLTLDISVGNATEGFDDIDSSDWCHPYVCAAVSAGIVNGIDEDSFGKGRVITREEMATMTYRAISAMGIMLGEVSKDDFADAEAISDWAKTSCNAMHRAGIINGMGDNHFAPKENVTRAQAAKILYEVLTR